MDFFNIETLELGIAVSNCCYNHLWNNLYQKIKKTY